MRKPIQSALVSVFYKNGLENIIRLLHKHGVTIYSTGGTQVFIDSLGVPCVPVEDITTYPSILDGRVKTLHPSVFGGILGKRDDAQHIAEMNNYNIPAIDLVIVDLYPFEETVASTSDERHIIEKIDIGDKIQLHMNRCILCYRCTFVADQLTNNRVHGVLNRGDHSEISTYIEKAVDNDFSGNMIDVCPVGALTDKTFRFKQRVWFTNPMDAHRDCPKCSGKVVLWMKGEEVLRVTARKDQYAEVKEYICNECRYDHKDITHWKVEGPRHIDRGSVISQNHYERIDLQKLKKEVERQLEFQKGKPLPEPNSLNA
mgnify:CR=1 FL=1